MKIKFTHRGTVGGHPSKFFEVTGLPFPVSAVITGVGCGCGYQCRHLKWCLSIEFPSADVVTGRLCGQILQLLLPHIPMKFLPLQRASATDPHCCVPFVQFNPPAKMYQFN